jgi:signal transduction histidine kinase
LIAGFGGVLAIFLVAGVYAVYLTRALQSENKILRDASAERSRRLASIRYFFTVSDTYFGDSLFDPDPRRSANHRKQLQDSWTRLQAALDNYPAATPNEKLLVGQLQQRSRQHWQQMIQAMTWLGAANQRGMSASFYGGQVMPIRGAVVEITARVEEIDSRQIASTGVEIKRKSEHVGRELGLVLNIALGAALLLASGCLAYILRIERQNRGRYQEILKVRGQLEQLSARLVAAHEDERRSISRELHDEVGQTLSAVLVDAANLAKRIPGDDVVAHGYLDNIRTHADASLNSVRDIALLLRPSMLDDLGLISALEWQAREVSRRGNVKVKVIAENVPELLDDSVRTCTYRIAQEALSNVSRHSEAAQATVAVRVLGDGVLILTVKDDGKGFDPARTRGLGLLGMEERVKQLGGRLQIQSGPGMGTLLQAELPLALPVT